MAATDGNERAPGGAGRDTGLDSLRALVLGAVIVVNMLTISGLAYLTPEARAEALGPFDRVLWRGLDVLLEGKALAAFSFLFGLSLSLILRSAAAQGEAPGVLFLRRLLVLAGFGLFNALFLFWADILMSYAALGLVLPLAARFSQRVLTGAGVALLASGPLVLGLGGFARPEPVPQGHVGNLEAYASPAYGDTVRQNLDMVLNATDGVDSLLLLRLFMLSGLFLLGLAAGRSGIMARPGCGADARAPWLRRGLGLLALGLVLQLGAGAGATVIAALAVLHAPVMALGYLLVLGHVLGRPGAAWVHAALAPLGRMSLTGYLMSAALGGAVFYGWGLGLIGQLGTAQVVLVALGIVALLAGFARFWFARFLFGPWEWLWRTLTRLQVQPQMRRGALRHGGRRRGRRARGQPTETAAGAAGPPGHQTV